MTRPDESQPFAPARLLASRPLSAAARQRLQSEMQAYAETLVQSFGAASAGVWVLENGVPNFLASAGRDVLPIRLEVLDLIAQTRQPYVHNSDSSDSILHDQLWTSQEGLSACAIYPLLIEDNLEGVMAVFAEKPFAPATLDTLTVVSRDLAQSIRRHRAERPDENAPLMGPSAVVAIIHQSLDGAITDWSPGAERLFGYSRAEAIGRPLSFIAPPDQLNEDAELRRAASRGEEGIRPDTVRLHQSGAAIEVCVTASPLRDPLGNIVGAVTVIHDIADAKRRDQQYQQAQKMEAFGKLAGGIAHDFNNLLTVITGYSEILINRVDAKDPVRDWLTEIYNAGLRAESLTHQLLAFSRKQMVETRVLDLNAVVSDTEKMLRRLIGEDILMTTIFAPRLGPVKIDPGQIHQVILNLAVNARDAMPQGGRLTIETDNVLFDETDAEFYPNLKPGPYAMLAVSDTGIGMNAATKGPDQGTGIGLAIVHGIVKQYAGHIEVFSEPGQGSTFKIFLPQVDDQLSAYNANAQLRTIPRGKETILLVEDDDHVRLIARRVLETCGYTVLEASDGDSAVRLAEAYADPIDLLVSDVVMPNLTGRALVDRLTALKPNLRVVFLSGYTSDAVTRHGDHEDEFAFLQKPITPAALGQKVRDELDCITEPRA